MKLSKFFRRYSRILLMFFMSLLLVVFLLGDVLQNAGRRLGTEKVKIGRAFNQDIYGTDIQAAGRQQYLVASMGFREAGMIDAVNYYLLTEEARRLGVRMDSEQAKTAVKNELTREGLSTAQAEDRLDKLQKQYRISYAAMFDAAGTWLAVRELVDLQGDALGESAPRIELAYRNQKQESQTQVSIIDAHALLPLVPEPTEAELQAFFDETKAREPNLTEDKLEFGYLLPDRVRLEYLTTDPSKMEPRIRVKEKELQSFFEEHATSYTKRVTPPQTQPSATPPAPTAVPMTFEEAKERVKQDVRADKAIREAQNLINEIRHEAYQPWQLRPRDAAGFHEPPPADEIVSFEALKEKFAERGDITYVKTELLGETELGNMFDSRPEAYRRQTGTMEPAYREGQNEITLSELALRVKGIFAPESKDTGLVLNLLEPSPVLIRSTQSPGTWKLTPHQAYVFRDIETQPKGPPASLDVVRGQLVEDWKLLKAHELAGEYARKLAEQARQSGLTAAIEGVPELKERLTAAELTSEPVGPEMPSPPPAPKYAQMLGPTERNLTRTGQIPQLGSSLKVQREVFALVASTATQAAPAHEVVAVDVANQFKWALVELEGVKPLYAGEFGQQRPKLEKDARTAEQQKIGWGWLAPQAVRERTGFVSTGVLREEAEQ